MQSLLFLVNRWSSSNLIFMEPMNLLTAIIPYSKPHLISACSYLHSEPMSVLHCDSLPYAYISWTLSTLWSQSNLWYGVTAHTSKIWFIPYLPMYVVYIYVWKSDTCMHHTKGSISLMSSSYFEPMTNFDILFGPDRSTWFFESWSPVYIFVCVGCSCTSMAQFTPTYQPLVGRCDHRLFIDSRIADASFG